MLEQNKITKFSHFRNMNNSQLNVFITNQFLKLESVLIRIRHTTKFNSLILRDS